MTQDTELHEKIGRVLERTELIPEMDKRLRRVERRVDSIFAWAAGIAAAISFVGTFLFDWISGKKG